MSNRIMDVYRSMLIDGWRVEVDNGRLFIRTNRNESGWWYELGTKFMSFIYQYAVNRRYDE